MVEDEDEDIITIHLGRTVSKEVYKEIVESIINLLDKKYPPNKSWIVKS